LLVFDPGGFLGLHLAKKLLPEGIVDLGHLARHLVNFGDLDFHDGRRHHFHDGSITAVGQAVARDGSFVHLDVDRAVGGFVGEIIGEG
jgi:hypothetical protein